MSFLFQNSHAKIYPEIYGIFSAKYPVKNAFLNISDEDEITVISDFEIDDFLKKSSDWKRISITIDAPPESTGIAAILTGEFAKHKVSIFPVASFEKAHIFVPENQLEMAKKCLENLGIATSESV